MFRKTKGGGKTAANGAPDNHTNAKDQTTPGKTSSSSRLNLGNGDHVPGNSHNSSNASIEYQEQLLGQCCPDEALIYAAPTVDTLGDEESVSRLYRSPRQNNHTEASALAATASSLTNTKSDLSNHPSNDDELMLAPNTTALMQEDSVLMPSLSETRPQKTKRSEARMPSKSIAFAGDRRLRASGSIDHSHSGSSHNGSSSRNLRSGSTRSSTKRRNLIQQQQDLEQERRRQQQRQIQKLNQRRKRRLASGSSSNNNKDFQFAEDQMSVQIRKIPVAERSAFDKKLPPYVLNNQSLSQSGSSGKKVSPSWQHWCVLQQLSSVSHLRQPAFSSSVGPAADIFWREEDDDDDLDGGEEEAEATGSSKSKSRKPRRDGRYRSIDPVRATLVALPKAPPLLSNKKHRLPMRTDVGFPRASTEEITQKQQEIRRETEWEEASPRLVVLVTGDDLGTAVQDEDDGTESHSSSSGELWNGSSSNESRKRGLPGMPWAGANLIRAKERNSRHFSRGRHEGKSSSSSTRKQQDAAERATSMLSPPLDAIPSGTLGWRPRPFHDRPPGLRYTLVCPMSVNFAIGTMEPLVGSLALYSLTKGKISEEFYFPAGDWEGKLQLDALQERRSHPNSGGNNNSSDTASVSMEEETELLTQLWNKRKHKAIFAHNSWAFGDEAEGGNSDENNKLYVVLQVYKVTHADSITAYWAKGGDAKNANHAYRRADKKTWRKKLRQKFKNSKNKAGGGGSDGSTIAADETDIEKALLRSNAMFDAYGTQFTSPLCFGITALFPEDSDPTSRFNTWPRGQVQQGMDLYLAPSHSESQEDFLRRLRHVASKSRLPAKPSSSLDASVLSTVSEEASESVVTADAAQEIYNTVSASQSGDSSSEILSPPKKKGGVRRFRTPKRLSKRDLGSNPSSSISSSSQSIEETPMIPGSVTLFTSNLDVDFLQSMLITPPELIDKVSIKVPPSSRRGENANEPTEVVLPRILVDASGDSAIMVDPKKTIASAKRSDLVRLPSLRLAEHLDASEFREVLPLTPEPETIFESSDHKSLLNLLYLYPKLLVLKSKDAIGSINNRQGEKPHWYTVRVRLIQNLNTTTQDGIIESRNEIVTSFHNPASWGGSNLLQSVFTRIPRDGTEATSSKRNQQGIDDPVAGIPLRDEFKMKLPTILDGSYFLQFSLFAVELNDYMDDSPSGSTSYDSCSSGSSADDECGIILSPLAEISIPLSSSSTKDPKSGVKATTVIPDGLHRLKLGNFQLQVETKLVSSMHVSDPVVAAALREFPVASSDGQPGNTEGGLDEMAISSRHSTVGRSVVSQRGAENTPVKIPYPQLMSSASGSALARNFQSLVFLHLRNLTKSGSGQDIETSEQFIVDNMQSLLVLFQQVKSFFLSPGRDFDRLRLCVFVKAAVDSFDELSYNQIPQVQENEDDFASEHHTSEITQQSTDLEVVNEDEEEKFDGGAIRKRTTDIGLRITKTYSTMESAPEATFSRVAYGASKSDHMRLEAELGTDRARITTLFDDDETVASLMTLRSTKNADTSLLVEAKHTLEKPKVKEEPSSEQKEASNQSVTTPSTSFSFEKPNSNEIDMAAFQQSISELQIGKRVKSAAQVMLAPCVTVTPGLAAFLCKTTPRNASVNIEASGSKEESENPSNASRSDTETLEEEDTSQQIALPGSDLDDDDAVVGKDEMLAPYYTPEGIFRGGRNYVRLDFSIKQFGYTNGRRAPVSRGSYVYESVMTLWLQAWSDYITGPGKNSAQNGVAINFLGKRGEGNNFALFYLHMDLLLPIVLKSIVMRYSQDPKASKHKGIRSILDNDHVYVFESFVEMLAIALMGQAMTELQEPTEHGTLRDAINACDIIMDFIIGLFAMFHPAHMEALVSKFFDTLRKCEFDKDAPKEGAPSNWTGMTLHQTKCSRQLRLRAVEKLAVLPNFVALNYPQRYSDKYISSQTGKSTWTMQCEIGKASDGIKLTTQNSSITDGLLPHTGWLASLLTNESLSICALSCETVVTEAIASIESHSQKNDTTPQRSSRPAHFLKRSDLLMFQSVAIHALSCVYELLLRRHAMDRRFQKDSSRGRIAALFTKPIFEKSLASVRWLARMESTHRVRSIWMMCFVYILQEAPQNLIREYIRSYSNPFDLKIHRFIRLLRLSSSTFQSFIDQERHCMFPLEIDRGISPWLLQESFNTVCATTILVVEESVAPTTSIPNEQRKMIQSILDLLLHVLTTPQSTVTHLRAVGGAIQAFEKFGAQMFLETTGGHLQHWIRVTIGLMNSTALSVRSIAVDFVVSLLCGIFDLHGNIEDVALIFATVLPEVVAREIALCSVNGLIASFEDAEKSIWPLRRSFADIEDANPLDDDRVDRQLPPVLSVFCRASQAIIDGVLVEMRLRGENCIVVGTRIPTKNKDEYIFDADEESLFEAASFFTPETSPIQRIRWLLTLKSLHESKGLWVEAAETLIMCARTISDAIPHLNNIWRPNRFSLWSDGRRSLWLSTVGEEIGNPEQGNVQVMSFANSFLEPEGLVNVNEKPKKLKLPRPTLPQMSSLLMSISKEAVAMYSREGGMDATAYTQLESLLKIVMGVLDDLEITSLHSSGVGLQSIRERKQYVEEVTCLRKVIASITADMTKLAEKLLLVAQDTPSSPKDSKTSDEALSPSEGHPFYVRLLLSGKKPSRFQESTSLPTFIEWDKPCICRVPKSAIQDAAKAQRTKSNLSETAICNAYGKSIRNALLQDLDAKDIVFSAGKPEPDVVDEEKTYVYIDVVRAEGVVTQGGLQDGYGRNNRRFLYSKPIEPETDTTATYVQMTVAISFPCPLSRQRSMLTDELVSSE